MHHVTKTVSDAKKRGVVIGYDHRHGSKDFAIVTAMTFLWSGMRVYMFPDLVHTPLVVSL